jgi:DNA-binding NtrC family response regulator
LRAKIVVIDAEPAVRSAVVRILETEGHTALSTHDFQEALEMMKSFDPDLVITDVFLPGIWRDDAIHKLRREFPRLRVLIISGLPDPALICRVGQQGIAFCEKPFTRQTLLEKVREALDNRISS